MLKKDQIKRLKAMLEEEKQALEDQVDRNHEEGYLDGSTRDATGEISLYDNHPADSGTELFERSKNLAMDEHHGDQLEKINDALKAIEEGSYGRCAVCEKEILFERLEAVPYTLYCLQHTPDQNISRNRPVEEDVLEQTHNSQFQRRQNAEMADNEDSFQDVAQFGTSETPADMADGDRSDYDSLYQDSESNDGFTEDYESFAATDIKGNERQVFEARKKDEYEDMLDDSGMESQLGNIPYKQKDSYIEEDKNEDGKR
ncbi:TraR/DksA C4-type zinc finger protein [Bacillus sp. T33-2]|uniref:TraR/DksA C4-type zinc finger protein n=1 Tax=Bacillus sp. T33-2 TaxID=2054168 RepID=UPI000C7656B0|nr:TraR/DksA C4-type zinc finger protein [Bacillus sp. T33-2]PLR98259.1 molecular chaperone DnaK [Bacillus sp. T33-2]